MGGVYAGKGQRNYRRTRRQTGRKAAKRFLFYSAGAVTGIYLLGILNGAFTSVSSLKEGIMTARYHAEEKQDSADQNSAEAAALAEEIRTEEDSYPLLLAELLERNEETLDFVKDYPNREKYKSQPFDLTADFVSGEVPLLMQWDKRWGYDAFGEEMIGLAGCGPLCMEMAYLYFTEDTDMTPRGMAEYAYDNGFYTEEGTGWTFWTDGAAGLGLEGTELSLDENEMKNALDAGKLIVCSMRPGDFTTTGHFILIRGYDEEGFQVNDPNRRRNSSKTWTYETLCLQIRNLWSLEPG